MGRQISWRNSESPAALEDRVQMLEGNVAALIEAVRVLAHGLQDIPTAEPGERRAAEAARRAYDLLLVAESPGARSATGDCPGSQG